VNGTNDHDVLAHNPTRPNPPVTAARVLTPRIWLAILEISKQISVCGSLRQQFRNTRPKKRIHRSPSVVGKPRDGDGIVLSGFVTNLHLALKFKATRPLKKHIQYDGNMATNHGTDDDPKMRG
jgi:hypothetical protein